MPGTRNETRMPIWAASAQIALLTVILAGVPVRADDSRSKEDAYQSVWSSLSELLRRREYGSASGLMESVSDDPELQFRGKQIEADKAVIAGLQTLEKVVAERLSAMPEGTPLEISGIECTFVRYDKSPKGNSVVLKSKSSGREMTKHIVDLPPAMWMQLAESRLESLDNRDLILGVFAGFDRSADVKAARKLLNEAASKGADVTTWLARLEQAEDAKKLRAEERKTKNDDPLIGRWRVVAGRGDQQSSFNVEYRANGTVMRAISRQTLRDKVTREKRLPIALSFAGKWQKLDDGTYKITYSDGVTGHITLEGDRYWGRSAEGIPLSGTRQVTKK